MGNAQFNAAIQKQEEYINKEMKTINTTQNCVMNKRNLSYSDEQLRGKLRLEYHGRITNKTKNDYVINNDWNRMRNK